MECSFSGSRHLGLLYLWFSSSNVDYRQLQCELGANLFYPTVRKAMLPADSRQAKRPVNASLTPDFDLHHMPANCPHVCAGHSYAEQKVLSWEPWRSRAVIYLTYDLVQICLFKAVLCDLISCLENSCGLKSKEGKRQEQLCAESGQLQTSAEVTTGHHILMMQGL